MEEFNDFMFEHTSKISLTDIIEARVAKAPQETEKDKVASPYTRIKSKKNWNLKPIIIGLAILLFLLIVVFVIIQFMDKEDVVTSELMGNKEEVFRL